MGESDRTLVLQLRTSRGKARDAAVAEVLALLRGLNAFASSGGPLAESPRIAWITIPDANLASAMKLLVGLGYTEAIDLVTPIKDLGAHEEHRTVRWKRRDVGLVRIYQESDEDLRTHAPDRRAFLLECGDGVVRTIEGYRGGRGVLEHRALPVVDARLLVNLVATVPSCRMLDPFAGGIVLGANAKGLVTTSVDIDPALRFGLARLSSLHIVGDAAALPFQNGAFDAVATEPPYHISALDSIVSSISEVARVVRPGGRVAFLVASEQSAAVLAAASRAGLRLELESAINRKGLDVTCVCWSRR
jgi:SAM-dependent methyltransferase